MSKRRGDLINDIIAIIYINIIYLKNNKIGSHIIFSKGVINKV